MRRRTAVLAAMIGCGLFLAACDFVPGGPSLRDPDATVRTGADPMVSVATFNLAPGENVLVQVNIAPVTGRQLLYIELGANVDLEVGDASRALLASSSSPEYFARGRAGLRGASIEPQRIQLDVQCRGSCVILEPRGSNTFYALIRNTSGARQTVPLFAYMEFYSDEFEPMNNSIDGAAPLPVGVDLAESGAIETLGDVDYWRVTSSGRVLFASPETNIGIQAELLSSSGTSLGGPYGAGSEFDVTVGQIIVVRSSLDRAAAPADSAYQLTSAP